jgi:hypothetical protein
VGLFLFLISFKFESFISLKLLDFFERISLLALCKSENLFIGASFISNSVEDVIFESFLFVVGVKEDGFFLVLGFRDFFIIVVLKVF